MTYTLSDLSILGAVIAGAARDEILPRFRRLSSVDRRRKSSAFDIVTDADEAVEAALQSALATEHHEASFVGEEAAGRNPGVLAQI